MHTTLNRSRDVPASFRPLIAKVRRVGNLEKAAHALHISRREVQRAIEDNEGLWEAINEAVREYRDRKSAAIVESIGNGKTLWMVCLAEHVSMETVRTWAKTRPALADALEVDEVRSRQRLHNVLRIAS